jgi:hypothetical protein
VLDRGERALSSGPSVRMREAEYGFPRIKALGSSVNRSNPPRPSSSEGASFCNKVGCFL